MPPICLHLSIAMDATASLHQPLLEQNMGLYLLGNTLPDIHLVSGSSREVTHAFDLAAGSLGSGVSSFLQRYSQLRSQSHLDGRLKMLVAGYLSHLTTDEIWVIKIYRPFFGPASPLKGDAKANVLDRALQFELDRRLREQRDRIQEITTILSHQDWEEASSFADTDSLKRWREFVFRLLERPPSWDNFPGYARSFLAARQKVDPAELESFLGSLPQMLKSALNQVPEEMIESFTREAVKSSAALTKEYIN